METSLKTCFKCNQEKPRSEFYKHPQMGDGLLGKCKECTKKDVWCRYYNNIEKVKEYERNRFKTKHRKSKIKEYQNNRRNTNPHKYKANCAVGNAIRDGKLERFPCFICGDVKSQAHHEDYSKPLEVLWLCFKHHRMAHGQLMYETTRKPSRVEK